MPERTTRQLSPSLRRAVSSLFRYSGADHISVWDLKACGWVVTNDLGDIPVLSGVYAIYPGYSENLRCLYVGQSVNLRNRFWGHIQWEKAQQEFNAPCIAFSGVSGSLTRYECLMIGLLNPAWNLRTPSKAVEARYHLAPTALINGIPASFYGLWADSPEPEEENW